MGQHDHFYIDLNDEVVRGSIILNKGELMWPPPKVADPSPVAQKVVAKKDAKADAVKILTDKDYFQKYLKDSLFYTAGLTGLIGLGIISPNAAFANMVTTLGLSGIVG